MKYALFLFALLFVQGCNTSAESRKFSGLSETSTEAPVHSEFTSEDEKMIREIMMRQQNAWNEGDLEGFMKGYWKNDKLRFIGSRGITYGWDQTLANYRKTYPDKKTMGKLKFDIISIEGAGGEAAFVIGKWTLTREEDEPSGHITLFWKKIKGEWTIVADHSS